MKQPIEKKKELLFKELDRCLEELKECADLNDVLMPLFYVLYAHKSGILVSIVGDADNIFSHRNRIQPYVDAEMNDIRLDILDRIRKYGNETYFKGKTIEIIDAFYGRNNELINEFYPELIEHIFTMYSKSAGKYSGIFTSPREITTLMYSLALQQGAKSIYDPCAGLCSGMIYPRMSDVNFVGQELNPKIKLFADIRMDAHNKKVFLYCENSLERWRGNEAECLCADFPIGQRAIVEINGVQKHLMFEDAILWKFLETQSLKKAIVLVSIRFCSDNKNRDLRKILCENNYVDTVIELPDGVLSYTGVKTAIVVLDKERETRNVNFVSASGYFTNNSLTIRREKTLDARTLLWRLHEKSDEQFAVCDIEEICKHDFSILPFDYIKSKVELQAGQKLVKFTDLIISEIRNFHYDDDEGYILPERYMCSTITDSDEHRLAKNIKLKSLEGRRYNKLTHPCIIFNVRADKFFIKKDDMPLFVSANYHAFDVDTSKCIPEYLVLAVLKSRDMVKAAMRGTGMPRIEYISLWLPIYEDIKTQQQIVDREFRQEEKQLRNKLAHLQTLNGRSSDLLHNLGVTFTRLDAAVENLRQQAGVEQESSRNLLSLAENQSPLAHSIKVLDDNIKYALRLINSTFTDFSKSEPIKKKVVLQEIIENYIEAWKNYGYATFSILPLKSDIPQTKVEVDLEKFYTALDCILINAHQHGFLKKEKDTNHVLIELKAVTIKDEKYALISVSNNGEPLPDGFTLRDFAARGVVGLNSSQDGLGGHHISSIAHLHDGFIAIEKSTEWLSFHILIPTYINAKETVFDEYECEYL